MKNLLTQFLKLKEEYKYKKICYRHGLPMVLAKSSEINIHNVV